MDIDARIRRRLRTDDQQRLALDYDALSPVTHVEDPTGRGSVVEELLDHLDPVFADSLPPDGYVWGPKGAGKSAVCSALFSRLSTQSRRTGSVVHTTTRARPTASPHFVYLDARVADSRFALYRELLDHLVESSVPAQGVGTDWMYDHLVAALDEDDRGVVVAVDHADEARTVEETSLATVFEEFDDVACLSVGRTPPDSLDGPACETVARFDEYRDRVLVDVLMTRADAGLPGNAFDHGEAMQIASWAAGDAHDALAALLTAADVAISDGQRRISPAHIEEAIDATPESSVSLARLFALSENRQAVLRHLTDLEEAERTSVTAAVDAISTRDGIDLSAGTVKRFLYQFAEDGVLRRVPKQETSSKGRPPSRVEAQFPARAFRRIYDAH